MKVSEKQLRRIIRETIEEVTTPGDTRYGMAGDARGGVRGRSSSRGVSFPGHSAADNEMYKICKNFKPNNKYYKYVITDSKGIIYRNSHDLENLLNNTNWKKLQK